MQIRLGGVDEVWAGGTDGVTVGFDRALRRTERCTQEELRRSLRTVTDSATLSSHCNTQDWESEFGFSENKFVRGPLHRPRLIHAVRIHHLLRLLDLRN